MADVITLIFAIGSVLAIVLLVENGHLNDKITELKKRGDKDSDGFIRVKDSCGDVICVKAETWKEVDGNVILLDDGDLCVARFQNPLYVIDNERAS